MKSMRKVGEDLGHFDGVNVFCGLGRGHDQEGLDR